MAAEVAEQPALEELGDWLAVRQAPRPCIALPQQLGKIHPAEKVESVQQQFPRLISHAQNLEAVGVAGAQLVLR